MWPSASREEAALVWQAQEAGLPVHRADWSPLAVLRDQARDGAQRPGHRDHHPSLPMVWSAIAEIRTVRHPTLQLGRAVGAGRFTSVPLRALRQRERASAARALTPSGSYFSKM